MTRLHVSPISGTGALIYRSGNALAYLVGVPVSALDKVAGRLANAEPVAWMAVLQAFQVTGAAVIDESHGRTRLRYTGMIEIQVLNGSTSPDEPDGSLYVGTDDVRIMHLSIDDRLRINPRPESVGIGNLEGGSMAVESLFIRIGESSESSEDAAHPPIDADGASAAAPTSRSIPLPPISEPAGTSPDPEPEYIEPDPTVFHVPLRRNEPTGETSERAAGESENNGAATAAATDGAQVADDFAQVAGDGAQVIDIIAQTPPGTVDVSPPDPQVQAVAPTEPEVPGAELQAPTAAAPPAAPGDEPDTTTGDGAGPASPVQLVADSDALGDPEELGKSTEELGKSTEELGKSTEELGKNTEELGSNTDELGKNTEELGKNTEELGSNTDELGSNTDELDESTDELGKSTDELDESSPELDSETRLVVVEAPTAEPDDNDAPDDRAAPGEPLVDEVDESADAPTAPTRTSESEPETDDHVETEQATDGAKNDDDSETDGDQDSETEQATDGAESDDASETDSAESDDASETDSAESDDASESDTDRDADNDDNSHADAKTEKADAPSDPGPTIFLATKAGSDKDSGFDAPYQPSFKKVPLITKANEKVRAADARGGDDVATDPFTDQGDETDSDTSAYGDSPTEQICVNGHRNSPTAGLCSTCGERLAASPRAEQIFMRPGVVGTLTFDDGEQYDVSNDLLVGRAPGTPVIGETAEFPSDPMMSREHFRIEVDDHSVMVRDLNSSNGTMVRFANDSGYERLVPGEAYPLSDGAVIVAGQRWATFALNIR